MANQSASEVSREAARQFEEAAKIQRENAARQRLFNNVLLFGSIGGLIWYFATRK